MQIFALFRMRGVALKQFKLFPLDGADGFWEYGIWMMKGAEKFSPLWKRIYYQIPFVLSVPGISYLHADLTASWNHAEW